MSLNPSLILGCIILAAWGYIYKNKQQDDIPRALASPFIKLGIFVLGVTVLLVGMS